MIVSVRSVLRSVRFVIMFGFMTCLLYYSIQLFSEWITPVDHYKIPEGQAVKVFGEELGAQESRPAMTDRLRFFYWYGE